MAYSTLKLAISTLLWTGHSAFAADYAAPNCTLIGAHFLSTEVAADELCRGFEHSLKEALAERGHPAGEQRLLIALRAEKRGRIKAVVTAQEASGLVEYPEVGLDVMDRPLRRDDLDSLANAAAQVIARN